ncbi:hypothetical protein ASPWEDRAFT_25228 [Aspergillus wentii DTO 134E9]|uniref:Uncharacterized protein n=1 Tax=Aspergillus wentii DTO 134E9 TaxID=1073089 RepID=A0A1L9RWR8_ASPWE|nr:uncharacterized protein ASPWEDRAFT_25228 [Aspergillus wentii DTO 134E9]OJJ39391.1 hypothetical protein ASPWEDRAFT_25228 [Aspergillus wentii DTO 134E9]
MAMYDSWQNSIQQKKEKKITQPSTPTLQRDKSTDRQLGRIEWQRGAWDIPTALRFGCVGAIQTVSQNWPNGETNDTKWTGSLARNHKTNGHKQIGHRLADEKASCTKR